jgi:uncharacterized protein (DUF433 family)
MYTSRHGTGKRIMDLLLDRISIDPQVCFGKPCIRGTRIWVSLILDFLASGSTVEEILDEYPQLEEADIRAALAYGAEMARERFVEVPLVSSRRNIKVSVTNPRKRRHPPVISSSQPRNIKPSERRDSSAAASE